MLFGIYNLIYQHLVKIFNVRLNIVCNASTCHNYAGRVHSRTEMD